jgi:hypothetical protein
MLKEKGIFEMFQMSHFFSVMFMEIFAFVNCWSVDAVWKETVIHVKISFDWGSNIWGMSREFINII